MPPISTAAKRYVSRDHSKSDATLSAGELAREAGFAYRRGCDHLLTSILPSIWSHSGCGWQEHWADATTAGFYASCDGLISLVNRPTMVSLPSSLRPLLRRVYLDHLCKVLDPQEPVLTDQQRLMRQTCLNTSLKLARFLQASACLPSESSRVKHLTTSALERLVTLGHDLDGQWSASFTEPRNPSLAATCEVLLALAVHLPASDPLLMKGRQHLLDSIEAESEAGRKLVSLWALTRLPPNSPDQSQYLSLHVEQALPLLAEQEDRLVAEFFPGPSGQGDYYHFNASLLGALAALRLLETNSADKNILTCVLPVVARTIVSLGTFGHYRPTRPADRPRFWENHQALSMLAGFCSLLANKPRIGDLEFMYVNPRHFAAKKFTVDRSLAVVLMPLTPEWSKDVLAALSGTLEGRGYQAWRSDLRFSDDGIMQTIWEKINEAAIVIADCTGKNPNVFYELGIAHTIGKPVFLCAQRRKDIPFDLAHIRSFEYGGAIPTQLRGLSGALESFLEDLQTQREEAK